MDQAVSRAAQENGFFSHDGARLFYRHWPVRAGQSDSGRVIVLLHRGHEHSGRVQQLVDALVPADTAAYAWDARGHGYSHGKRGDAPDFMCLVRDFEAFIQHLQNTHGCRQEQILVIANSVGAVIAATWIHDYAPRVRGLVMAASAFDINLYVPLAKPALRLGLRLQPELNVTSYVRASMLTHCEAEAKSYDTDPLVTKNISARVLIDLADTAQRVVADAAAIDLPVLMLVAGKDYVVKTGAQKAFYDKIRSVQKRWVYLPEAHHALLYEKDTSVAFSEIRTFINECFALPEPSFEKHVAPQAAAQREPGLQDLPAPGLADSIAFGMQRFMMRHLGWLSEGITLGMQTGFDSGASLDYVYRNRASGKLGIGALIDRGYLDAIGWRGIRERKQHLEQLLSQAIAAVPAGQTIRILDLATGGGRYVLETVKRFGDRQFDIELRDYVQANLDAAAALANQLGLADSVRCRRCDAFSADSYQEAQRFDIVVISGLFELFSDNALLSIALQGVRRQMQPGAKLIYTGQPWHPQLAMIAHTLTNHQGKPWVMRPRPQAELDALVAMAGGRKLQSLVGIQGIFSVSLAEFAAP
ncbi:bifunctional alpha/beta hydrolase/class I SAM-dependent methyltransferase [Undibacterium luofuense]|uniref:bifunctional alpha/beta hydrolase/class I SAM-dependent methyltransferase n=1 Tax=Undibacterium luofuense TaxID=2828733 RepID=UPI0030EED9E2